MKKLVILSLVLALFTLAACSQADEKSAVELSAADTGVSKADIQSSENSIVIWDSSLPDTADKLTYIMNGLFMKLQTKMLLISAFPHSKLLQWQIKLTQGIRMIQKC